jgi:Flp pilus assembly protein TadG
VAYGFGKLPEHARRPFGRAVLRRRPDAERGTVSIEFALLSFVFFAILFGILAYGLQFSTRIALTYAASEGGRAALAGLDDAERESLATAAVRNALQSLWPLVDPDRATITVETEAAEEGNEILVSIDYTDDRFITFPFIPPLTGAGPVAVSYFLADPSG